MHLRLATRGSALALWQAHRVSYLVTQAFPEATTELVIISTSPDRIQDRPLREWGDKGLFVKEVEDALREGRADAAVHSLKDVPGELPEDLELVATPERVDPRDVLISRHAGGLQGLPSNPVIGTSSLRRGGQLLRLRPDAQLTDIRGNIDTRIRKAREGQYDAIVLAAAGLTRLDLTHEVSQWFSFDEILPAPTQGILAVEAPRGSQFSEVWRCLDDEITRTAADAERELVAALGADCHTAAGCYCYPMEQDRMYMRAVVVSPDGRSLLAGDRTCSRGASLETARQLAADLLSRGAGEIIAASRPPSS